MIAIRDRENRNGYGLRGPVVASLRFVASRSPRTVPTAAVGQLTTTPSGPGVTRVGATWGA